MKLVRQSILTLKSKYSLKCNSNINKNKIFKDNEVT